MCLDTVSRRYWRPRPEEFTAYKYFQNLEDGCLITPIRDTPVSAGLWLKAKGFLDAHGFFRTGFYCYKNPPPSHLSWDGHPIIPVRVRGLVTTGMYWSDEIVIVREMFIPENWRELALHVKRDRP